jgi:hypothetical protein
MKLATNFINESNNSSEDIVHMTDSEKQKLLSIAHDMLRTIVHPNTTTFTKINEVFIKLGTYDLIATTDDYNMPTKFTINIRQEPKSSRPDSFSVTVRFTTYVGNTSNSSRSVSITKNFKQSDNPFNVATKLLNDKSFKNDVIDLVKKKYKEAKSFADFYKNRNPD